MGPIRTVRAIPKRQVTTKSTVSENMPSTTAVYGGKGTAPPSKLGATKNATLGAKNGAGVRVLGEVTNATAATGVVTRRGSKGKESLPLKSEQKLSGVTPKEESISSPEVFTTPPERFADVKADHDVEGMELDTTAGFVGSSGRTIDLVTGKELSYDLSKVVDYDAPNAHKLEEYALYVEDVFRYYRQRENDPQFWVDPDYISRQTDITWNMRSILMDWIVDLQESFALSHETLYLAAKIVDLYLTKAKKPLQRDRLQLLGITAVFIASKYEERNYVRVDDLVYMTEDSYRVADVFSMEIQVLKTIGFQLGHPMAYRFLRRFAKARQLTMETLTLARYILESSLLDHSFLGVRESHMAAGALYLARRMVDCGSQDAWDDTLIHYSAVDAQTAKDMALRFNQMLRKPKKSLLTVQTKYEHEVFMKVGSIPKVPDSSL